MANLVQELLIKIGLKADTAEAVKASKAIGDIASKSKQAGSGMGEVSKNSKDLASALGKNVEVGGQAVSMIGQLGNVSKGGAEGMAAAARSGLAFGQMLKGVLAGAGPIGIAVTAITVLGAAAYGLVKAFAAPKESIEDFKARIANLDKANLQALDATIAALSDRLKTAKADADAVRQSLDMIDDAEMGAKLAANKESGADDKEKARQELLIRGEFKQRRQAREQEAAEQVRDQAKEKLDAIAPQFDSAREDYIQKLNILNENKALAKETKAAWDEVVRLQNSVQGAGDRAGWAAVKAQIKKSKELQSRLPSTDEAAKMDVELASSRDAFQGKDGVSDKYQSAANEAIAAEKALARLLDTREKVSAWEKAQIRIENGGIDPRDVESAARKSPGKARIVGPDGKVREYDVGTDPTANQRISAAAESARSGRTTPTSPGGTMIGPDGQIVNTANQPTGPGKGAYREAGQGSIAKPLQDTAEAIKSAPTGVDTAKAAEDLKTAAEEATQAQQAASEQTIAALTDLVSLNQSVVMTLSPIPGQVANLRSEIQRLWGAVRSVSRKSNEP